MNYIHKFISLKIVALIILTTIFSNLIQFQSDISAMAMDSSTELVNDNNDSYYNIRSNATKIQINPFKDLILRNDQIRTINGDFKLYGNISLINNSTLVIQNGDVEINGWINLSNTSRLLISNTIFTLNPPDVTEFTTIVNLTGDCQISIKNSTLEINKQSIETRVPFILSDENSKVDISDSTLITEYPSVPLKIRWTTAGLLLMAGSASWTLKNTKIIAHMNDIGAYRWCILQGSANFKIINVENSMNDPVRNAFIKPNAGLLECFNSTLIGRMPVAVLGQAKFFNTTISADLDVLDNAIVSIENSSVKKIQIGFWSGVTNNTDYPSPILTFIHSNVDTIFVSGNSMANLINSDIRIMLTANKNAKLLLEKTVFNTPTNPVTISDNVTLVINRPLGLKQVMVLSGQSRIELNNLTLTRLTINREILNLKLYNATIEKLRTFNNMKLQGELKDSKISEFINSELDYGFGIFNFTLINSMIPKSLRSNNLTTQINYRLKMVFTLNEHPISKNLIIDILNKTGSIISTQPDSNGQLTIDLQRELTVDHEVLENEYYILKCNFMGFSLNKTILLNKSQQIDVSWHDVEKPKINDIKISPSNWNSQKYIVVKAKINDKHIKVISNVSLKYSTTGGRTWKNKQMYNTQGDNYEAIIPRLERGTKVTYYIVAYDMAGNQHESVHTSIEIGKEENISFNSIIALLVIICFILIILQLNRNRKIQKYKLKISEINSSFNKISNDMINGTKGERD
jgi:hypothetical protein